MSITQSTLLRIDVVDLCSLPLASRLLSPLAVVVRDETNIASRPAQSLMPAPLQAGETGSTAHEGAQHSRRDALH